MHVEAAPAGFCSGRKWFNDPKEDTAMHGVPIQYLRWCDVTESVKVRGSKHQRGMILVARMAALPAEQQQE
jgi:hypothetical protein